MPEDSLFGKLSYKQWIVGALLLAATNGGGSLVTNSIFGNDKISRIEYNDTRFKDSVKTDGDRRDLIREQREQNETIKEVKTNLKFFFKKQHIDWQETDK